MLVIALIAAGLVGYAAGFLTMFLLASIGLVKAIGVIVIGGLAVTLFAIVKP